MSTDRLIIHSSIAGEFLGALHKGLSTMLAGSPPPPHLVSSVSKSRLQHLVCGAISQGAFKLIGGDDHLPTDDSNEHPSSDAGIGFRPMVIGNVTENMELWQEENFGPVVSYMIAKTEDEAVAMANGTKFGLSASVFTKDLRKGLALAKRLQSGYVFESREI